MSRLNSDVIIALLLMVLSGALFADTFSYQKVHLSIVGAKLWPRVVLIALFVASTVFLLRSMARVPAPAAQSWSAARWIAENRNVLAVFSLYVAFLLSLPWLGMLLGGMLFVFAVQTAIGLRGMRAHLTHAAVAVVAVGGMWAVFTYALGVVLPAGVLLPS
jgi:hypothetical protein